MTAWQPAATAAEKPAPRKTMSSICPPHAEDQARTAREIPILVRERT